MTRDFSLDIIRIAACLMVVLMHAPMPAENICGPFLVALSYLTAPCIGLFFMVSGALLMPVRMDYAVFVRKRLNKILVPTIVWSLVYISVKGYMSGEGFFPLRSILSIPFSAQGHGVLWFMYTLAGLYLVAPILSAWLDRARRQDVELVLWLWAVTLCYPVVEYWLAVNETQTGLLYYFGGYAGYFLLGYYLKRYPSRLSLYPCLAVFVAGALLLFTVKCYHIEVDFYRMFWYLSIFVAAGCVAVWIVIHRLWSRFSSNRLKMGG